MSEHPGSSSWAWGLLRRGILPVLFRQLQALHILDAPTSLPERRPLLVLANHTSWWDGFLVHELQQRIRPQAELHTLMLQRELDRAPFLRRTGCIGLDPERPSTFRQALRTLEARLRPGDVVQFFPQGRIVPSRARPMVFKPGWTLLARVMDEPLVLPVGLHLEMLNHRRPTAFVACGAPIDPTSTPLGADVPEREVASALDRLHQTLDTWGEAWQQAS